MSKRDPVTHRTPEQMKQHYKDYHGTPEQIRKRSQRNAARRKLEAEGKVRKGDGMDVDHKTPIRAGGGNAGKNLRVIPKSRNRGWRDGV
jgi:5-methylcytosine-specific restriction endonuclease McrA